MVLRDSQVHKEWTVLKDHQEVKDPQDPQDLLDFRVPLIIQLDDVTYYLTGLLDQSRHLFMDLQDHQEDQVRQDLQDFEEVEELVEAEVAWESLENNLPTNNLL